MLRTSPFPFLAISWWLPLFTSTPQGHHLHEPPSGFLSNVSARHVPQSHVPPCPVLQFSLCTCRWRQTQRDRAEQSQRTTPCLPERWGEAQRLFCCLGFIRPVLPGTKPYTNVAETSFSYEQETLLLIPVLPSGGLHPFQPVLCPARPSPQLQGLSSISILHVFYIVFCASITKKYFLLPAYSPSS